MIIIDDLIKEVSQNTGIDKELVSIICKHPFLYTIEIMKNDTDTKDILFNRLFKFKLKRRFKENKQQKYTAR